MKKKLPKDQTPLLPLFRSFRGHLNRHQEAFARLQLLGRLEDYLTKEFAGFVIKRSGNSILPILNSGKRTDGRRIDLALAIGDFSNTLDKRSLKKNPPKIRVFVELKYVCNRQAFRFGNKEDDIGTTLSSLHKQLKGKFGQKTYATYPVELRNTKRDIYGIVFASHVQRKNEKLKKTAREFADDISDKAKDRFCSHNAKNPGLREIYGDARVPMLKGEYQASLFAGVWRLKSQTKLPRTKLN